MEQQCTYCKQPAEQFTIPPLCPAHFDLVILIEFMVKKGMAITLENTRAELALARSNGGSWTISEADLEHLLPSFLLQAQK